MVYTLIDNKMMPYDVQNLTVKPFAYGSWFHLSFEHFMTSIYGIYELPLAVFTSE